jgi:putative ABC transport system permease protein
MSIFTIALKSLLNRKVTVGLTLVTIALSVALLLGVEKVRIEAKTSFANTISGTDLIVGARSGPIPLLLYSVFRIGNATNNISWQSYSELAARPEVAWTIPLSLGDSHQGFRVLGTSRGYFEHYRFGAKRALTFTAGAPFDDVFDAVIGADVAKVLGYKVGDQVIIEHGLGQVGFSRHEDKPFHIAGVLAKTGTPVDRTVHVSLEGMEAIHLDWRGGSRVPGLSVDADKARHMDLQPRAITAFMVGLKSRTAAFSVQRAINEYRAEPLLAILPGAALQELWELMGTAEAALAIVSIFVVVIGLLGMLTMLLASLNERRREMAILRSLGARPAHIFSLLVAEATIISGIGAVLGLGIVYLLLVAAQPIVESNFGLFIAIGWPTTRDAAILGLVVAAGFIAGAVPAYRAYRQSLADGMMVNT